MNGDLAERIRDRWGEGHRETFDRLLQETYRELQQRARKLFLRERPDHTLQATALVHEVWFRLRNQDHPPLCRAHFLALAALMMRRVLINHAERQKSRRKSLHMPVEAEHSTCPPIVVDLLDLQAALEALEVEEPEAARVVELRFFGGLSIEEIAEALEVSQRTVHRRWDFGRAWLLAHVSND